MQQTMEDKVAIIRESLQAGSAAVVEVSGAFRVDFTAGQSVYIYVETFDNSIVARFETKETDPGKRRQEAAMLRQLLLKELCFATISEFKEVPSGKGRYSYTAMIQIDESVIFHQTIIYGADISAETEDRPTEKAEDAVDAPEDRAPDLARAEKAIEMLETIDAKMLRQSLDMMNLKRSSNVRLVLTRIFRDAVEAEELLRSIQRESVKLNSENDFEELRIIKTINLDESLEPVIGLLYDAVFNKNLNG